MFDADRPILQSSQDRLGRAQFARHLARCLLDHTDPGSLVVGLYGNWGSGKTSVINLIVEELKLAASNMANDEKPIILNFSPWSYSGQNQLIYAFFRRLSSMLRESETLQNKDRIIHLLELYVSFFTKQPVPKAMRTQRKWLDTIFHHNTEEIYGWESGRDLTEVKAELNSLLRQEKCRIIIMVDNISRLYDHEIKQIFQIVKSMGDYANSSYLLAFDKEHVVNAINKLDGGGGEDYIEKIVQLPFEIPPISQQDIEPILADRLLEIVATVPGDAWNNEYWASVYYSSLRYFFRNCRDVAHYINTLSFSYPRLKDIVNPVDYFALTAIEVFMPAIYSAIRDNKDLFTDLLDHVYLPDEAELKIEKSRCDEILSRAPDSQREILLDLLLRLFPRLYRLYQPAIQTYHSSDIARRNKRICSPDLFDTYFRLSLQTGNMAAGEFENIIALANNTEEFDRALIRLNQDGRILKFLDLFSHKTIRQIPQEHIPAIIAALLDNGDLFQDDIGGGPLSLDTPMHIHRIINELLHHIPTSKERFNIMNDAIANSLKSLYIIVHELREQSREHLEHEDTYVPIEYRMLTPDELVSLKKTAVTRIQYWAHHGILGDHPKILPILTAWLEWDAILNCRTYVAELTNTDRGLIAFLCAVLTDAIAEVMTEYHTNPAWSDYLKIISDFVPPESLEKHAKILFEDDYYEKLREREQLALIIFLDIMKSTSVKEVRKTTADD